MITRQKRPVSVMMSVKEASRLYDMAVQAGIQRGLNDIEAGRYFEITDETAEALTKEFEAEYL